MIFRLRLLRSNDKTIKRTWFKAIKEKVGRGSTHRFTSLPRDTTYVFFKGYGGLLQYEDSCTAEDVILAGMNEHIVCLPVHDSFRVRR